MSTDKILPFLEAAIRVFDRHGERTNRSKARLKFFIKKIGLDSFKDLVVNELKALEHQSININEDEPTIPFLPEAIHSAEIENQQGFDLWRKTNVFEQKQKNNFAVFVRVKLGNISSQAARKVADIVRRFAADDIRLSINQGFLLKFIKERNLYALYSELKKLDLAAPGFDSTADITACPGTDTCNLGIADSTNIARYLESIIQTEYPELVESSNIKIKISGCMNSCGQHMAANIGFHGSSIKRDARIIPAMIVVLGGGVDPTGEGFVADKVLKVPTKRIPQVLRVLLNDYSENALENEYYNTYYRRLGKHYFSSLIEPIADTGNMLDDEFMDWGSEQPYFPLIGVGECAGVSYDLVSVILEDAKTRFDSAKETFDLKSYSESVYYSYNAFVIAAKALLLAKDIRCNSHMGIINDFQEHFAKDEAFAEYSNFSNLVMQINQNQPGHEFAKKYLKSAQKFLNKVIEERNNQLRDSEDKLVIENFYKA